VEECAHPPCLPLFPPHTIRQNAGTRTQSHITPPVVVQEGDEGDNAYKIEQVLDARPTRNRRGWEYLVKWLGYGDVENMWLKRSDMTTSAEAVGEYYTAHPNAPQPLDLDAWLGRNNAHPGVDTP
jgi:hypothetical protein